MNSRHLLQLTGANTVANPAGNCALQVTTAGVNSDLNLCYLNGLKNDLCQHVQLDAVRQSGVSFDVFAGNTNKLMSAMGSEGQLGRRVRSLQPVEEGRYKATWKREFKLPWRKADFDD